MEGGSAGTPSSSGGDKTINLRQLRYFAMVVKTGGMSHAAARLKLAQTAISIQIRDLEREIGVSLFERHSRGVAPTKAGEILYERYNELERFLDRTLKDVQAAAGSVAPRPFIIGLTPSHMRLVGADVLIAAGQGCPQPRSSSSKS